MGKFGLFCSGGQGYNLHDRMQAQRGCRVYPYYDERRDKPPEPEGNPEGSGIIVPYIPTQDNIPFPNKDSAVAVASAQSFSFGLDFVLFGSWKIFLTL